MNCRRHSDTFVLLLLTCLFNIRLTSTQEGSSYFFYQKPEYPRDCTEVRNQCSSNNFSGVYTIRPDGYPQPFEVYCDNDVNSGAWAVIQRRNNSSLTFKRNWEEYRRGFGFLSSEFWIGNDRLSYLTNQAVYELRIDVVLSNGSSFYVKYNSFRISDEWSGYAMVSAEHFRSNLSCIVSTCPLNMTSAGCTCQNLCTDPIGQTDCYTDCIESCAPKGCLLAETNSLISNGDSFINEDCTQNCTCVTNQLSCSADYECSADATCTEKNGLRKCYCNDGYDGDGETCTALYTDCYEAYQAGQREDGVYTILPTGWPGSPFNVSCDMTTAGGGWTVFQRRIDGVTDFYRYWDDFKHGFGSVQQNNDFWLGNEQIYYLTNQKDYKLRVDIRTSVNSPFYEEYTSFRIDDEASKYQITFGSNTGTAGNGLDNCNNGGKFSTRDQDNDGCNAQDFAEGHRGAWWHNTAACHKLCTECFSAYKWCRRFETRSGCNNIGTNSNLNGDFNGGNGENIFWYGRTTYCNLNSAEMKIRPRSV